MAHAVAEILAFLNARPEPGENPARLVNGDELGAALDAIRVVRPVSLAGAQSGDLAFFFNPAYRHELPGACPGILITGEPFVEPLRAAGLPLWKKTAIIACADPYLAMAVLSGLFAPELSTVAHLPSAGVLSLESSPQVHPSAVVADDVKLGKGVVIGAHVAIERGTVIGAGSVIYPGCIIGPECQIGNDSVLFPRVVLYEQTRVGDRVRIHAGTVLGADGFGYASRRKRGAGHQKIYHLGRVVIGDDVEVGANSCVDRGTFGDTRLERHAKADNLVQIAHNAHVDEGGVICGGTCLAGNASVGKYAYVGGLTGITNQVHVGDGAQVGACSLINKDVPPGGKAVGNPQREYHEHFKVHALLNRLLHERKKGKPNGKN